MRRHNLLYVIGSLEGGGYQKQLVHLLRGMDRAKYRPAVAVWRYRKDDYYVEQVNELGVPVFDVNSRLGLAGRLLRLRNVIRRVKPKLIHAYAFTSGFPSWLAALGQPANVVGSLRNTHSYEVADAATWRAMLCFFRPRCYISNNHKAIEESRSSSRLLQPKHVQYVGNGLDLAKFDSRPPKPPARPLRIVGIGRLVEQKNWALSIDAVVKARTEFDVELKYEIYGEGPDQPALLAKIAACGAADYIELKGFTTNVSDVLFGCHLLMLSSREEGSPNAVMEAMATGRPVVATDAGDVARLVRHEIDGYVFHDSDFEDQGAAAILSLSSDAAAREKMGAAARKRAEELFGLEKLVAGTFEAYRRFGLSLE